MPIVTGFITEADGHFGVSFPDFPGFAGGGETMEDAMRRAQQGLAVHVEALIDEGIDVAKQIRSTTDVLEDQDVARHHNRDLLFPVLIDLPGRQVRLNISLEESLIARIDRAAAASGETRSGYLAHAAKARLAAG